MYGMLQQLGGGRLTWPSHRWKRGTVTGPRGG